MAGKSKSADNGTVDLRSGKRRKIELEAGVFEVKTLQEADLAAVLIFQKYQKIWREVGKGADGDLIQFSDELITSALVAVRSCARSLLLTDAEIELSDYQALMIVNIPAPPTVPVVKSTPSEKNRSGKSR